MANLTGTAAQGSWGQADAQFMRIKRPESKGVAGAMLDDRIRGLSDRSGISKGMRIPHETIRHIIEAISKSKKILALEDDWDDAGSPAYKHATWNRAKDFLIASAHSVWISAQIRVDAPKILPGPDGSIDIHWKSAQKELLINIPEDVSESARYYGDNKTGQIVKGNLNISVDNRWLMMWLMQ